MCAGLGHRIREPTLIRCGLAGGHSIRPAHVPIASCAEIARTTFLRVATQKMVLNISCSCDVGIILLKLPNIKCQQTTSALVVALRQHDLAKLCGIRQPKWSCAGVGKFS